MTPIVLIHIIAGETEDAPELGEDVEEEEEEEEEADAPEPAGKAPVALLHCAFEGTVNVLERITSEHYERG